MSYGSNQLHITPVYEDIAVIQTGLNSNLYLELQPVSEHRRHPLWLKRLCECVNIASGNQITPLTALNLNALLSTS